jgi:hypothetical protein
LGYLQHEVDERPDPVFESWVANELCRAVLHRGRPEFHRYRESRGLELDLLAVDAGRLVAVEVKSAATVTPASFRHFDPLAGRLAETTLPKRIDNVVVFGGEAEAPRSAARVVIWRDVGRVLDASRP